MKTLRRIALLTLLAVALLTLAGCAGGEPEQFTVGVLEMNDAEIDAWDNWMDNDAEATANDNWPENYNIKHFPSLSQMLMELEAGKIYYLQIASCTAKYICAENSAFSYVMGKQPSFFKMAVMAENEALRDELNAGLDALGADGTLERLTEEYITDKTSPPEINALEPVAGAEQTIKVGITGDLPPFDYIAADGVPAGFNVALLNELARVMQVNFELISVEANARTTALSTGMIDVVFWMKMTAADDVATDSTGSLLFTHSYFADIAAIVTKDYPVEDIKNHLNLE